MSVLLLMLRNRSRAVKSKQALMAEPTSSISPAINPTTPISSFLGSPRFFNGFLSKNYSDVLTSPASILDTKNSVYMNPFGYAYDRTLSKPLTQTPKLSEPIGLALVDSVDEENISRNRMVLLKSMLTVQIPTISPPSIPAESPIDFGIKTRNSQLLSQFYCSKPAKEVTRQLSWREMELSEEYTCVISHGPNPKITHIFDNCIVESCSEDHTNFPAHKKMEFEASSSSSSSLNFLSFCHTCKVSLENGKDIYLYRGEKAFCSEECRSQEMLFEGMKNPGKEDDEEDDF